MFTGIVQEIGQISRIEGATQGLALSLKAPKTAQSVAVGDSICTSGVCLTCTQIHGDVFDVDVSTETLRRTTLGKLKVGDPVNLEQALRLSDPIGGHLVTGHIDGTGRVTSVRPEGTGKRIAFSGPPEVMRYVVAKGSITVDGVSLTIAVRTEHGFEVALIPHTLSVTTLDQLRTGSSVNLEADIIGKYVERLIQGDAKARPVTWESLAQAGYTESPKSQSAKEG